MNKIGLIFPNQLYKKSELLNISDEIFVLEYSLFFGEKKYINNFHKKKLILHRASMKYFYEEIINCKKHYLDYDELDLENLF